MSQYSVHINSDGHRDESRTYKLLLSFIQLNEDMRQLLGSKMVKYDVTAMITGLVVISTVR